MTADPTRSEPGARRRGPRRVDAAGTGPASADGAEPRLGSDADAVRTAGVQSRAAEVGSGEAAPPGPRVARPAAEDDERGRWLRQQRPPHWG